jgi:hypothetical protein
VRRFEGLASSVADQDAIPDEKLVAFRVSAEIVVVVEEQDRVVDVESLAVADGVARFERAGMTAAHPGSRRWVRRPVEMGASRAHGEVDTHSR